MTRTALITGASGGIGHELAKLFARDHHNLVLVARSTSKLNQFADELQRQFGIVARAIACDLSAPGAAQALFDQVQGENLAIDFLVNNAGYGAHGDFAQIPLDEAMGQIQLNITALTALTKLFLDSMIQRRSGRILNVASTAAFQAGPLMAVYYASKAYVLSFSEALANELKPTGVTVTCLCPGPTETGFQERASMGNARLVKFGMMSAKAVALEGYRGMLAGKPLVIAGFRNWLVAESVRFAPRRMVTAVSRKLAEKS
jgi:short-subunit dehydrogenase